MRNSELEAWVLRIADQLKRDQPYEDTNRVELKSQWPDPVKTARQLAGHANVAHGEPILWIIGIDEKKGVVGAVHEEMAIWLPSVSAQFDGIAPELIAHLNVPIDDFTVVALAFDTTRPPYVIKNPEFGKEKGGVKYEVPWREGTMTRTARREDLIRVLAPLQTVPSIETLSGRLTTQIIQLAPPNEWQFHWRLEMEIYIAPANDFRIVIPYHRCSAVLSISESPFERLEFEIISLKPPSVGDGIMVPYKSLSKTIEATQDEVLIEGAGRGIFSAWVGTPVKELTDPRVVAQIKLSLLPVNAEYPVSVEATLYPDKHHQDFEYEWNIRSG